MTDPIVKRIISYLETPTIWQLKIRINTIYKKYYFSSREKCFEFLDDFLTDLTKKSKYIGFRDPRGRNICSDGSEIYLSKRGLTRVLYWELEAGRIGYFQVCYAQRKRKNQESPEIQVELREKYLNNRNDQIFSELQKYMEPPTYRSAYQLNLEEW